VDWTTENAAIVQRSVKTPGLLGELLQLGVLGFGLLQDGDVGVGVFPEREEVARELFTG
jgi:hypothetical protein